MDDICKQIEEDLKTNFIQETIRKPYWSQELENKMTTGDVIEQFKAGHCYYKGKGVQEDKGRGMELIKKSERQGNIDAREWLKDKGSSAQED